MTLQPSELLKANADKAAHVALKVFFNITNAWGLRVKQQRALLGNPAESTFFNWKSGKASKLSQDTMERISFVMGIYKALGVLFPTRQQADEWVNKPNRDFGNESALTFMLKGSMINLSDTRRYLDAQRG
jgi:hypothetical protein